MGISCRLPVEATPSRGAKIEKMSSTPEDADLGVRAGRGLRVLVAPDKFRGTLTQREATAAMVAGLERGDHSLESVVEISLSDGGEGFLESFGHRGGARETCVVTGPAGVSVRADLLHISSTAVVESALASGLCLVPEGARDALAATSRGTGELIVAARRRGARRIIVGLGGSASTDGGLPALRAIESGGGLGSASLVVGFDTEVRFLDAARCYAAQKGARPSEVAVLTERLDQLARRYREDYGRDVTALCGAGAGGGLGGGLVVAGGVLCSGFELVAEAVHLDETLETVDLIVTGEGCLDAMSFSGKVVGRLLERAARHNIAVLVVVGRGDLGPEVDARARGARVLVLTERFGEQAALFDTARCVERGVAEVVSHLVRSAARSACPRRL